MNSTELTKKVLENRKNKRIAKSKVVRENCFMIMAAITAIAAVLLLICNH